MLDGAFALLERSLRLDLRSGSTHLIRLGLMIAIYFPLCIAWASGDLFGAPGLRFFKGIVYVDLAVLTLLGIGFFSTVITEEKEEDTLGLMLMAGISPLGILAGKSLGGLWQAILLIAIQYPFILLAVTMGGVTRDQVWAMTIALSAYIVFLAGFGLLCSTISSSSKTASWRMGAGLMMYFILPGIAWSLSYGHAQSIVSGEKPNGSAIIWTLLDVIAGTGIFLHVGDILSTGFNESAFSVQVFSNIAMGVICVGLAWLLFGIATRNPSTEANTRGLIASRRSFFRFTAGRVWTNPFIWKDFHFVSGGIGVMIIRLTYFGGLGLLPFFLEFLSGRPADGWSIALSLMLILVSASINAGNVLARSMQDEVRGQTLASLMMLPRSSIGIVYFKFGGALLGWLPGPIVGLAAMLTSESVREGLVEIGDQLSRQQEQTQLFQLFIVAGGLLLYGLFFVLIPHFAALLALYVRWGAVPLAIVMTIGAYIGVYIVLAIAVALLELMIQVPGYDESILFMILAVGFLLSLCAVCHMGVLSRVRALAAK